MSGEVLRTLERLNLNENTFVIFTSDNGPWFEGSPGPYRDRKGSSWEGGQRVPFIAQWQGQIPHGLVSDEPTMNIDIFPTFLNLAGAEFPSDKEIDGKDILSVLTDGSPSPHDALLSFRSRPHCRCSEWSMEISCGVPLSSRITLALTTSILTMHHMVFYLI